MKSICRDLGKHWDLVIFNTQREFNMVHDIIEDNCQTGKTFTHFLEFYVNFILTVENPGKSKEILENPTKPRKT